MDRIGDYQIVSLIGSGGAGVVRKAVDIRNGQLVAIKSFSPSIDISSDSIKKLESRFTSEIEIARKLAHPNIVSFIDEIIDSNGHHFIMEYIDVQDMKLGDKWPVELVVNVMIDISKALSYAHKQGVIHRDIKPENILIGGSKDNPVCKLTDFGVAYQMFGSERITVTGEVIGTFFYMSPEQIEIRECSPSTDLYALGLVGYEMLTGRRAHNGDSPASVIGQIMQSSPPPPSRFRNDLSLLFERIIQRCIRKDQSGRYQNAQELIDDLESLKAIGLDVTQTRQMKLTTQFTPLIGRDRELSQLTHALAGIKKMIPKYTILTGPTGIGKTRLTNELLSVSRAWGVKCVSIRIDQDEKGKSYGLISKLVESLVDSESQLDAKWVRVGLSSLSNHLSNLLDENPPDINGQGIVHLIEDSFLWLIRKIAQNESILITIDDFQWADSVSVNILKNLMKLLEDASLFIVLTINTDIASYDCSAIRMVDSIRACSDFIMLNPLDSSDIRKYTEYSLGIRQAPEYLIDFIERESAGNPLYIIELLKSLIEANAIVFEEGIVRIKEGTIHLPEKILRYQNLAMSNLDEDVKQTIRVSAIIGPSFNAELLALVLGKSILEIHAHLDKALANQIIRVKMTPKGNVYSFSHEKLRKNIVSSTSNHFNQRISQKTANAIETLYSGNLEDHLPRLIYHHLNSITPSKAIPHLIKAGKLNYKRYQFKEALEYAQKGFQLAKDNDLTLFQVLSLELCAIAEESLGKPKIAFDHLEESYNLAKDSKCVDCSELARIVRRMANVNKKLTKDFAKSIEMIKQAFSYIEGTDDYSEIANVELSFATMLKNPIESMKHVQRALEMSKKANDAVLTIKCHGHIGNLYRIMGRIDDSISSYNSALHHGKENGLELTLEGAYASLSQMMFLFKGDIKKGRDYAEKARKLARRTKNYALIAFMNVVEASEAHRVGNLFRARDLYIEAIDIWHRIENKPMYYSTKTFLAWVHLDLGDIEKTGKIIDTLEDYYKVPKITIRDVDFVSLKIEWLVAYDRWDEAIEYANSVSGIIGNKVSSASYSYFLAVAYAKVKASDIVGAWRMLRELKDHLERDQTTRYIRCSTLLSYAKMLVRIIEQSGGMNYLNKALTLAGAGLLGKDVLSIAGKAFDEVFLCALGSGYHSLVITYYLEHIRFLKINSAHSGDDMTDKIRQELQNASEMLDDIQHPKLEKDVTEAFAKNNHQ